MQITVDPVTVMTQSLLHWWANDDQVLTVVAVEEALGGDDQGSIKGSLRDNHGIIMGTTRQQYAPIPSATRLGGSGWRRHEVNSLILENPVACTKNEMLPATLHPAQ